MKSIYIKTYGCSFNQADSENMAGLLQKSGEYKLVNNEKDADMVIINSCSVKNRAEDKFWSDIKNIKKPKILAGCVPQAEKNKSKFKGYSVIGTNQINNVVDVVNETVAGNTLQLMKKEPTTRINVPKVRSNSVVDIVPINEGCLGSCNFCKTKFARGHLHSYKPQDIVKHIRNGLNDGAKEFWLTSQDTACYGYDIDTNIVHLLKQILEMKRDFKIRLGMGNPDFLPDYLDEIIEVFKDPRIYSFVHIPVQAGSDKVLRDMKREYTVQSYKDIVAAFKKAYPQITIATDIICGYPGETEEDFEQTMQLVKETKPEIINISRFWARPGTVAAKKTQIPPDVIKKRSMELMKLFQKISKQANEKWIGWEGKVFVTEKGKNNTMIARNQSYKQVIVPDSCKIGEEITVKVTDASVFYLVGEIR